MGTFITIARNWLNFIENDQKKFMSKKQLFCKINICRYLSLQGNNSEQERRYRKN
jgi:hypothetical protein